MTLLSPASAVVSSVVAPPTVAALLLCAAARLAELNLRRPTTDEILAATGASRSRAYELKPRVEALLSEVARPVGRPSKLGPTPAPTALDLAGQMLDYVLNNLGCVSGPHGSRRYSDGLRHHVLELIAKHPDVPMHAVVEAIRIPLGTLKDWGRSLDTTLPDERVEVESTTGQAESESTAPGSNPRLAQVQTVLTEWKRWDGGFTGFCEHLRQHCAIPFGRSQIATILEACGVRMPRRRQGRSPDETALHNAFETFFPHAQWVGDGTQVVIEVDGVARVYNIELNVDAYSAAFVGAHVSPTEDSEAVIAAFQDARDSTGVQPIALLLDNKPSNHIPDVDDALQPTSRIRATSDRPQNKAHAEGAFGLLKPTLEGLTLAGSSPDELAASFLRALVIVAGRAINHRPRKDRQGRSRVQLLDDTPSAEDVERAKQALEKRMRRQELARKTRAARQDPVVRATIADAYSRLGLDDPDGHLLTATARYPLDAAVEGIAIFESRQRMNKLPAGVDARYLLGIIRNIDGENDTWDLAMALWDERVRAGDRIARLLDQERNGLTEQHRTAEDQLLACIERALTDSRRLQSFFWLTAAADLIRAEPDHDQHRLFRLAARRIAAAHSIERARRITAQRFLAAKLRPLR